jgi:hypothetical protein
MRLVMVHGRSQHGRGDTIEDDWLTALRDGAGRHGRELPADLDIRVPFYGDVLDRYATDREQAMAAVARGDEAGVDTFEWELADALRRNLEITDAEVQAELDAEVVARGPQHWEWLQGIGRAISRRVSPGFADWVMKRFLPDVNVYLNRPHVTAEIDAIVEAELDDDTPTVVVGHSLGSIVTYRVLAARSRPDVPLFLTVGSPLGIEVVKDRLPRPLGVPGGVRHWTNAADERDIVALHARLDRSTFVGGIENLSDVRNPDDDVHGIVGYLADQLVVERLADAVTGSGG